MRDPSDKRDLTQSRLVAARDEAVITPSMKYRLYPFVVAKSDGVRMWDKDGNEYLDWMATGGTAATGYGHPKVRQAAIDTINNEYSGPLVCYIHEPAVELAERLIDLFPGGFAKKAWFGVSGSDAMDMLAKVAPIASGRPRLVSYIGAFHGMTIGSGAISGHGALTRPIPGGHITKAPYPNPYRCAWGPCDKNECSLRCLDYLKNDLLVSVSPSDETAAIFAESIQSDSGEIVPPDNYFPALRELCDERGIWLIFDEVKVGLGRTGRMFGFEHFGIEADAIGLAKPLGGGFPLSAVVGREEILDVDLYTAYTLGGSPLACSAAVAVLDVIEEEGLVRNAGEMGRYLRGKLNDMAADHPLIGDVRGKGLLIGVELVKDQRTREPAETDALRLAYRCFELGLILLAFGNVMEITPPLTITREDADEALDIFDRALADIEAGRFDDTKLPSF